MTTRENVTVSYMLSEVEKQIRKDIPRLMELREGCYIMDKITKYVYKIYNVTNKMYRLFGVINNDSWDISKKHSHSSVSIIGHDIMLNDVLEWLDKKADNPDDRYFQDLGYTTNNGFLECWRGDKILFKWNLQSPYLKDQSEALINFLYNLVKE